MEIVKCQSCGESMTGMYCANCGEKKFEQKDLSLRHFLSSALDLMFFVDNKIVRSYRRLFFSPGFLTKEFIEGKRVRYMKPLQLFFLSCLVYFIFLVQGDIFFTSMKYAIDHKPLGGLIDYRELVEDKARQNGVTVEETINEYDLEAQKWSKALMFLFIPVMSLVSYALLAKKSKYFVANLTFMTHWLSFLLPLMLVWIYFSSFVLDIYSGSRLFIPIVILSLLYLIPAARRTFRTSIFVSTLYSVSVLLCFAFFTLGYRLIIALITFHNM